MIISKQKSTVVLSGLVLAIGMTLSGLTQAVIPEKICLQAQNPPRYASFKELENEIAKSYTSKYSAMQRGGTPQMVAAQHSQEHPEDFEPSARRESIRLKAALYHLHKGRTTHKGDLHLDYTEIVGSHCLNTSDFTKALKERGESNSGHYLTAVRVEVKNRTSCFLPPDRSIHSWMTAPRKGTLKFKIYGDEPCRQI